jgi:hypothetical protein
MMRKRKSTGSGGGGGRVPVRSTRRGSLLPELAISGIMLMIVMGLTVKVLGQAGQQRRSAEQRQRAILEVANIMERITAEPFDKVTAERAHRLSISPGSSAALPDAELAVEVNEETPAPGRSVRRIAVRLRWKGRSGEWEAPIRLTTWIERGRTSP